MYPSQVTCLIFFTAMLFMSGHSIADELEEGIWTGIFFNLNEKRYKIKYNVSYETKSGVRELQIQMINLDLEPMPEYTYQLTDIIQKDRQLRFTIPRKEDTKQCILNKQEDSIFRGECQSDKAEDGQTSQISMIPPPEAVELNAISDQQETGNHSEAE